MSVINLGKPRSYKEAGDVLLDKIDLNNVQMSDYNNFIRNILPRYLSQPIIHDQFTLTFSNWYLDDSDLLSEDICKENGKSRELTVKTTARLRMNKMTVGNEEKFPSGSTITFSLNLTKIPLLSDRGSFLVKGVNRVMVSHLERSNTLLKGKERNGEKMIAFSTSARAAFKIKMNKGQAEVVINAGPGSDILKSSNRNGRMITTNLSGLLHSLNIDSADDVREVVGINPYLHGVEESYSKKDDCMSIIGRVRLNMSERVLLNKKLSFRNRLSGKILDETVEIKGMTLNKGDKVLPHQATALQEAGITSVAIKIPGGRMNIINNGFLSPEQYIDDSDMIDTIRKWDINSNGEQLKQDGYHDISKDELDTIKKDCERNSLELKSQLNLHQHKILGGTLVRQDIIAIINLFSAYLMGLEGEDDKDSLANKSLINISTIFETLLSSRMYGPGTGSRPLLRELINEIRRYEITSKNQNSGLDLTKLDCKDNDTITSSLIKNPWSKLFQVESNVNPLDEINHKRKVSLMEVEGRGGISTEHSDPKPKSVSPSHMGRLCPIESPEGENVGLVIHLATLARLNENGIVEAPFFKINHETQEIEYDKAIYMDYAEEILYTRAIVPRIADRDFATVKILKKGIEIASYELEPVYGIIDGVPQLMNLDILERTAKMYFNKHKDADLYELTYGRKDWFIDKILDCVSGDGKPIKCEWKDVDYVTCRGEHILSAVTGNIPFAEYDDGTRLMMGAAMSKQTEPVIGSEPPLIKTYLTNKIGRETSGVIVAPFDCEVKSANSKLVTIASIDGTKVENIVLDQFIVTNEKTVLTNLLRVKPGDVLIKGDVIADTNATNNGTLQIGTQLLVAYIPWKGYNYEDAILISDRLLKEDVLTSYRAMEYDFIFSVAEDISILDSTDTTTHKAFRNKCDERGIIKVGTYVRRDDTLAVKVSKSNDKPTVVKHTGEVDGVVVRVDETPGKTKGVKKYTIVIASKEKINIGDKLAGRHGNKGVISRIVPAWQMPYMEDGTPIDILLTPLGIPSRMNIGQLLEAQVGLVLWDAGISATYDARTKVDVPKIKALTNAWTGDEEGKMQLYNGETGLPLMMKSTVGVTTIHKLKHLASHKIYARGSGSPKDYTLEGHPTQGKKRGGGQRIGEMEYWSFNAHGAVNCFRELQTYKSDDPENRKQWKKHLRGDLPYLDNTSNIPRSYRIAVAELMACGIDLRHLATDGTEIDVFEDRVKDSEGKVQIRVHRGKNKTAEIENEIRHKQLVEQKTLEENMGLLEDLFNDLEEETEFEEPVSLSDVLGIDENEINKYIPAGKQVEDLDDDEEEDDYFELEDDVLDVDGGDELEEDIFKHLEGSTDEDIGYVDEIDSLLNNNKELEEEDYTENDEEDDSDVEESMAVDVDPKTGIEYSNITYDEDGNEIYDPMEDVEPEDMELEDIE